MSESTTDRAAEHVLGPDDRCPCGEPQEGSGYCSYACFSKYEMGAPLVDAKVPHAPAVAAPEASATPVSGMGGLNRHGGAQAVDITARILVGTDWDDRVPYTDMGSIEHVEESATRIDAALRPVHLHEAAASLKTIAAHMPGRSQEFLDGVAYAATLIGHTATDMETS